MSNEGLLVLIWYLWKEETHSLVPKNHKSGRLYSKNLGPGGNLPFGKRVSRNGKDRRGLNLLSTQKQTTLLRVRTFLHQTFQVYHVYSNFIPGYICRIILNFGTLKHRSLLINIFASNDCFSDNNYFYHKLATFERNRMIRSTKNLDLFDKNLDIILY